MKACPDAGRDFDADTFAGTLQESGVDFIGFHAKCNQGFCYYRTRTGIRHPSMPSDFDLFGETLRACNQRGIQVSAYLNCGLAYEVALQHPEWCIISPDGKILHQDIPGMGEITPYMRTMCFNSPYRDYFLSLVKEVMEQYPVAGFLFDSFNAFPCVCPHCIAGMRKLGMDFRDLEQVNGFARLRDISMAEDISRLLRSKNPEYLQYYLGIGPRANARIGSYMECECLPTNPVWGYDSLPISSRYYRTLTSNPVLNMTGRFYDWGDFGSLRTEGSIEYDLFFGLANGMRPNIGDHIYPSGKPNSGMFERVKNIYRHVRRYEKWYEHAVNQVDIGVVLPKDSSSKSPTLVGVTRLLSELNHQFDFIDSFSDWSPYRVIILPDELRLNPQLAEKTAAHLAAGKTLFASGESGMSEDGTRFVFEQEFGIRYLQPCQWNPAYFQMAGEFSAGLPELPLATRTCGMEVETLPGTVTAGFVVEPYWNKSWDGIYSSFYAPPHRRSDIPFATLHNKVAYCAFPLFTAYYQSATVEMREIFGTLLNRILPNPLLIVNRNLPSFARTFVTESPRGRMVHLLNYVPELRGKMLIVENGIAASGVEVRLRLDGPPPRRVVLAPEECELAFSLEDGYLCIKVPDFSGYALVACESE